MPLAEVKSFIKGSVTYNPKCYFSEMTPKGNAETANNKQADISQATGGRGAETWAPPMSR